MFPFPLHTLPCTLSVKTRPHNLKPQTTPCLLPTVWCLSTPSSETRLIAVKCSINMRIKGQGLIRSKPGYAVGRLRRRQLRERTTATAAAHARSLTPTDRRQLCHDKQLLLPDSYSCIYEPAVARMNHCRLLAAVAV